MHRSLKVVFIATALCALSSVAVAGGDMHGGRAECRAAREAKLLPTYDANRDGQLDQAERQSMHKARRAEKVARYDADRDGQLSEAEHVKMKRERVAEKFGKLDANRDGAISRQEASGPCSRLGRHFDKVDQDRNGSISQTELGAARRFGKHHGKRGFHRGAGAPQMAPEDDAQDI
jgi:hypothetical protein